MEQEPAERTPVRYPDPAVQILDPSFAKYRIFQSALERLATGFRWAEGPVWFGDGRYLLWSDIPNNRIMRWEEETGRVSVFRRPSNLSMMTVIVPSYSVRVTRRVSCSQVTSRPWRSRVLPLALLEGWRNTLTAPVSSCQRMMRLLGMSLHRR